MAHDETAHPAPRKDALRRLRHIVCAEINARRVNEALERGRRPERLETFVCECGTVGCAEKLTLALDDYLDARRHFERFLVAPGHDVASVDTIVERRETYWVVEKRRSAIALARAGGPTDDGC